MTAAFPRQLLHHQAAPAPGPSTGVCSLACGELPGNRDADEGGDLFRLIEIFVRRIDKRVTGEADNALVALHASPWIDGHGEMSVAEKRLWCAGAVHGARDIVAIVVGIAPDVARRAVMNDEEADRPIGLGLQDELAVEFQRRSQHRGQRHRLSKKQQDLLRVSMPCEDLVHDGTETNEAPACARCF